MNLEHHNRRIIPCERCHKRHEGNASAPEAQLSDSDDFPEAAKSEDEAISVIPEDYGDNDIHEVHEHLDQIRPRQAKALYDKTEQNVRAMKINNATKSFPLSPIYRKYERVPANEPLAIFTLGALQRFKEFTKANYLSEIRHVEEIQRAIARFVYGEDNAIVNNPNIDQMVQIITRPSNSQRSTRSAKTIADKDELEPCGMMTTITELDCGCRQRSKKPIFTTRSADVREYRCSRASPQNRGQFYSSKTRDDPAAPDHQRVKSGILDLPTRQGISQKNLSTFNSDLLNAKVSQHIATKSGDKEPRRHSVPVAKNSHSFTNSP